MTMSSETHLDKLVRLKRQFLEDASQENHLYDVEDLERIKLDDWYIERYLLHCKDNYDDAFSMLQESMRWRKSFGVNSLSETDFPREYYQSGSFFTYAPDKKGRATIYIRGKLHRKLPGWSELNKKFFVFKINQLERQMMGRNYCAIWDCADAGLSNVDMDMLAFMLSTISQYFPYGLEYVLILDLPMILAACYNLARRWVPEHYQRLAILTSRDQIINYIDRENLPRYLGGTCKLDERSVPPGVMSARELETRIGLPLNSANKLEMHLKQYCLSE